MPERVLSIALDETKEVEAVRIVVAMANHRRLYAPLGDRYLFMSVEKYTYKTSLFN